MRLVAGIVLSLVMAVAAATPAAADGGANCNRVTGVCKAVGKSPGKKPTASKPKPGSGGGASTIVTDRGGSKKDQAKAARATERQVAEDNVRFKNEQLAYQRCLSAASIGNNNGNCAPPKPVATLAGVIATGPQQNATIVTITPEQAAYMALAQLQLPTTPPGIGPDPSKNEWDMAAVGYPLWVWADGPTHVGPVTTNVANLRVSLDARLSKTLFKMGDGHSLSCRGGGTPYKSWVKPGSKSPTCGYVYEKPSLPRGKYTVTAVAYWAVTWNVGGATGVINVPQQASAQLPVGELQAVVTR